MDEDEAVLAVVAKRVARIRWLALGLGTVSATFGVWIGYHGVDRRSFLGGVIIGGIGICLGFAFWIGRKYFEMPARAFEPRILAQRADGLQRNRRLLLVVFPAMTLMMTLPIVYSLVVSGGQEIGDGPGLISLPMTLIYLSVLGGPGLDQRASAVFSDEVSQFYRAKAMATGFGFGIAAMIGLSIVSLYRPTWVANLLPLAAMWTVASACLRFAWLDWRSDHDG